MTRKRMVAGPEQAPAVPVSNPIDRITKLREKIVSLQGELERVQRAPCDQSEAMRRLDLVLERADQQLVIHADGVAATLLAPAPPRLEARDVIPGNPELLAAFHLTAHRDAVRQSIAAALHQRISGQQVLGEDERRQQISRIESELLDLEREEEALIRSLEAGGLAVQRHPDANPAVILDLESDGFEERFRNLESVTNRLHDAVSGAGNRLDGPRVEWQRSRTRRDEVAHRVEIVARRGGTPDSQLAAELAEATRVESAASEIYERGEAERVVAAEKWKQASSLLEHCRVFLRSRGLEVPDEDRRRVRSGFVRV